MLLILCIASQVSADQGYTIQNPSIKTIPYNTSLAFNFHVFNSSTGGMINTSSLACEFHLYNSTGYHILQSNLTWSGDADYYIVVDASNFSSLGSYSYIVQCGNANTGGFQTVQLLATTTGNDPVGDITFSVYTLIFIAIVFGLIFLFLFTFGGMMSLRTDFLDVSLNIGTFFALFVFKYLAFNYLNILLVNDILSFAFEVAIWTNVVLPFIALILTMTLGSFLRLKFPNLFGRMPGYKQPYSGEGAMSGGMK